MAVIGGINCLELMDGFSEGISVGQGGGPRATKAYLCQWPYRFTVANAMLGFGGYTGGTVTLPQPLVYPESSNMWVRDIAIKGLGAYTQGPKQGQFDYAAITASFGYAPFNFLSSTDPGGINSLDPAAPYVYASQSLSSSADVITTKPGDTQLAGGIKWGQPFGRPLGVIRMHLVLHSLPYLVPSTIRAKGGQLNSSTIWSCAARFLKLDGFDTQRTYNSDGMISQDTSITASYRPEAAWDTAFWNGSWLQVQTNAGASIWPTFDFHTLVPSAYNG